MRSLPPIRARRFVLTLALALAAFGAPTAAPAPTFAPVPAAGIPTQAGAPAAAVDLSGIKTYLVGKTGELKAASADLKAISDRYYDMAKKESNTL